MLIQKKDSALKLSALMLSIMLASCGGGSGGGYFGGNTGGGNTGGGDTPSEGTPTTAQLLSIGQSKNSLNAGGQDSVTLTIRTLNNKGGVVPNANVTIEIVDAAKSGASLSTPTNVQTDENGLVTTDLSLSNNSLVQRINRTITVIIKSGQATQELEIPVNGTTLTLASDVSVLEENGVATITLRALDAVGAPLMGANALITDVLGNQIGDPKSTDNTGRATFEVPYTTVLNKPQNKLEILGQISVSSGDQNVSNLMSTEAVTLIANVSNNVIQAISNSNGVAVGEAKTITVKVNAATRAELDGKTVKFATSNGDVLTTDAQITNIRQENGQWVGEASTTLIGAIASVATVSAQFGNHAIYIAQKINPGDPATVSIQSESAVLAPGANTKVTALVKDSNGSPVPNAVVTFKVLKDTSSTGRISQPTAVTDSAGRATVIYTAGSAQTLGGGVEIQAIVGNAVVPKPVYSEHLRLTVARQSAFITVSHNHQVIKQAGDETNYYKQFSASVVDTAGNAVANQPISISLDLVSFTKGYYSFVYDYIYSDMGGWGWWPIQRWSRDYVVYENQVSRRVTTFKECPSSEFPNPIAVLSANGSTLGTTATFTTDAEGKFDFNVRYGRNYANWVRVNLNASTTVSTKDNLTALSFVPPVADVDVDHDEGKWRPDRISPYGQDYTTCSNYR